MKTLYITLGNNIVVDTENNTVDKLNTQRQGIDYMYTVDEPMHVVYGSGDIHEELDVEKGDILITFYEQDFKHKMIVVKNDKWSENIAEYNKKCQEEKERWAKKQSDNLNACENEKASF